MNYFLSRAAIVAKLVFPAKVRLCYTFATQVDAFRQQNGRMSGGLNNGRPNIIRYLLNHAYFLTVLMAMQK